MLNVCGGGRKKKIKKINMFSFSTPPVARQIISEIMAWHGWSWATKAKSTATPCGVLERILCISILWLICW